MKNVNLIFPHQLFKSSPLLDIKATIYLIEEFLFFKQYKFHKQKIAYHRATMKHYEAYLISLGFTVIYIESIQQESDIRILLPKLKNRGIQQINYINPTDNWLEKRIKNKCKEHTINVQEFDSPLFLNTSKDLTSFFKKDKIKFHQTTFYTQERKKRDILIDNEGKPQGGKWTFDVENRKKYPAKKLPPAIQYPDNDKFYTEAVEYVTKNFSDNLGNLSKNSLYPTCFKTTQIWFSQFLEQRFAEFGTYEDAIVSENSILNHSVLTPMLNIGLINPDEVITVALKYAKENNVPINSTEGFLRQI